MGAYVEAPADIDRLMEATGDEVGLLFDSGHAAFAGRRSGGGAGEARRARLPRALQGRAAGGGSPRAQPQLELSRGGDQRRLHRAGGRRDRLRRAAGVAARQRVSRLAGRGGRAGSGGGAQLSLCGDGLPAPARPGRRREDQAMSGGAAAAPAAAGGAVTDPGGLRPGRPAATREPQGRGV